MDLYSFSLLLGAAGLGAMALLGFGSHGHDGGHAGHAHDAGHVGGHGSHGHDAHAGSHGHDAHHGATESAGTVARLAMSVLSPRVIFAALVGFGATGMLLRSTFGGPLLLGVALGGALAFELAVVAPLWRFLMRFASKPALTLESAVLDEVHAVTAFDGAGQGLVSLEMDGQVRQVLATLQAPDRDAGVRVRVGDRLRVESVDGVRNRCTVSFVAKGSQS